MTEHTMMTAAELAEAREWAKELAHPAETSGNNRLAEVMFSLIATVDALTQRAKRAEDENRNLIDWLHQYGAERNEALALASIRGRALKGLVEAVRVSTLMYDYDPPIQAVLAAEDAINTSAPEALRRQQKREAALEAVVEAAKWVVDGPTDCECWPNCRADDLRAALKDLAALDAPDGLTRDEMLD